MSRGYLMTTLDASLRRLGVDHVDLWQVHVWSDDVPAGGDAHRARPRGHVGAGVVRRGLQLHRLAERAPAATWQSACPDGPRWPRPRWSTPAQPVGRVRGDPGRGAPGPGRAAVVAARPGRADRKYRTGTPADSRAASPHFELRGRPTSTSAAPGRRGGRSRPTGSAWSPIEVALAWVRDRPGVTAPIVGARPRRVLRGSLTVEECEPAAGDRRRPGRRLLDRVLEIPRGAWAPCHDVVMSRAPSAAGTC